MKWKTLVVASLFVTGIFLFPNLNANAAQKNIMGPPIGETIDFLKAATSCNPPSYSYWKIPGEWSNVEVFKRIKNKFTGSQKVWAFFEDITKTTRNYDNRTYNKSNYFYSSNAFFKDLDTKIIVKKNQIQVSCRVPNCFSTKREQGSEKELKKVSKQYYSFCDERTAQRVVKALVHAIKLNGGRRSSF